MIIIIAIIVGYVLGIIPFLIPKLIDSIKTNKAVTNNDIDTIIDEYLNGKDTSSNQDDKNQEINSGNLLNEYLTGIPEKES